MQVRNEKSRYDVETGCTAFLAKALDEKFGIVCEFLFDHEFGVFVNDHHMVGRRIVAGIVFRDVDGSIFG